MHDKIIIPDSSWAGRFDTYLGAHLWRQDNFLKENWAASWQKPTKWALCPVKIQISLGIRPVWSESSLCPQWVAKNPLASFLHADSEDADRDWADAQADLSPRWAHMPFYWFCHEAVQLFSHDLC